MNKTQQLQQLADQKFGKDFLKIVFQRFTGFFADVGPNAPAEMPPGTVFLGDFYQAKAKLEKRQLS